MTDEKVKQWVLVFDTETTGLIKGPRPRSLEQYPYITQITAILYSIHENKIVKILNEYVALPDDVQIEQEASQITGITKELCRERGRPIEEILQVFCEMVFTCNILVAHNYDFDSDVIKTELFRCSGRIPNYYVKMFQDNYLRHLNVRTFCTMKNSVELCSLKTASGRFKYPKLIELYRSLFGLSNIGSDLHNSAVDTWVCLRCFLKIYCHEIISDEEFAEKLQWLVSIPKKNNDSKNTGLVNVSISSRTRQLFPL